MRYLYSVYSDAAKIALQSILAHKLRAFLTLIGIIIGVAAVVVVGNANALIGGSNNSFALQPLSFEGQTGLNIALGVASLELRPAGPGSGYVGRRQHHRKHVYR